MYLSSLGKALVISCFVFITGCSSTKPVHVACDFVGGAADNAINRHEKKGQSDIHGNEVKNNQNSDTVEGALSVLSGIFTRTISSENKNKSKCT